MANPHETREAQAGKAKMTELIPLSKNTAEHSCALEYTGHDIFVIFDGRRVAVRGKPRTLDAMKWVSLERSFEVYGNPADKQISVLRDAVRLN